jgi:hypothetical protein
MPFPSLTRQLRAWLSFVAVIAGCAHKPAPPAPRPDDGWTTGSPGGLFSVQVQLLDLAGTAGYPAGARPYYRAFHGMGRARGEVLGWSPLGITRQDEDFTSGLARPHVP